MVPLPRYRPTQNNGNEIRNDSQYLAPKASIQEPLHYQPSDPENNDGLVL
jgi:hypothetical protein